MAAVARPGGVRLQAGGRARDHDDELRALLVLRQVPGLGDRTLARLLERYGSARALVRSPARLGGKLRQALRAAYADGARETAEAQLARIRRGRAEARVLGGAAYPESLLHLSDPPPLLFLHGRSQLLAGATVAIVGTRRPSRDGLLMAERLAAGIANAGGVVVSGLALGIDAAAHRASLPSSVAVLGCGTDVFYPRHHRRLQQRLADEGLLVSEFPPGTGVLPHHFPQRNRIIAALSRVVVVVEAPARSGALITADHATDLGREVMAVPGSPGRASCEGSNGLIVDGARMVTRVEDVLEELDALPVAAAGPTAAPAGLEASAAALLGALAAEPCTVDELCERSRLDASRAGSLLLELELRGLVRRLPGQRYLRV